MKTAVSLPDPVFEAAEELAKRLKLSRSALYARALQDYVRNNRQDDVTARLNKALAAEAAAGDIDENEGFASAAATATLQRTEWTD